MTRDRGLHSITARLTCDGGHSPHRYIDTSQPFEKRQQTLRSHYGFDCRCGKCLAEQRKELKGKMHARDGYLAQQRAGR